jgi:Uncharacterised protein family (UPF0175)
MAAVTIDLPEGTFNGLANSPEGFVQELRLAAASFWYSRGEVSQGNGAQIAGLSRRDFIEALGRAQVDAIQIDDQDLKDKVECDHQARRERRSADLPDPHRAPRAAERTWGACRRTRSGCG